jgi:outer membrane receptor protein involved in Fe transport
MRKFITFCLISLLFIKAVVSQDATLVGTVADENKESLIGVNIVVDVSKGWATQTDFDGRYSLKLPAGKYQVVFSYIGKQDQVKEVNLRAGDEKQVNVFMLSNDVELNLVTVSGGKYEKKFGEETVSMEIVPTSIIESNVAQAQEALNKVPGFQNIGESPSIRGGSSFASGASSRTLFLIDGIPQLSPENGGIYFETLPLENLQQVEVIKGAASSLYGSSALNGIVNFRTAWPKKDQAYHRLTTAIGMYQRFTANAIKSKNEKENRNQEADWWWDDENHLPVFLNQTYEYRESFDKIDVVFGAYYRHDQSFRKDNEYDRFRLNGKLRHISKKFEGLTIGTAWNFAYEEGGQFFMWSGTDRDALLPSDPASAFNKDVRTDYVQRRMALSPFLTYFDNKENKHDFNFRLYNNQSTNFTLESNQTHHVYGEYTFEHRMPSKGMNIISGAAGSFTTATGLNFGGNRYNASNAAVFTQVEKKFFDKLNFTGGIRIEYNKIDSVIPQNKLLILSLFKKSDYFKSPVKPLLRFGMNYEAAKGTYLRASWGQGFRVPTINEYFIDLKRTLQVVANPNLLPENGWSTELGIKQGVRVGNWQGFFDMAGFVTKYVDLIDFTIIPGAVQAQNQDNARIAGFELSALGQGKLFGYPLTFLAGYTFMQPVLLNPDSTRQALFPETFEYISYRNKHNFKADIEATIGKFGVGVSSNYTSFMINIPLTTNSILGVRDYRDRNPNGEWVFDMRLRLQASEKSNLTFVVKNLFNNEYTTRPGILEAPRNYTIQYQHAF